MQVLAMQSVGAAAVAAIYVIYGAYRDYLHAHVKRESVLRQRVAYMLWTMAEQIS